MWRTRPFISARNTTRGDARNSVSRNIFKYNSFELANNAETNLTRSYDVEPCEGGQELNSNQLHPYFLGCEKVVEYVPDVAEFWINSMEATRWLKVNDPHILNRPDMLFKRRSTFTYCISEHRRDPSLFQIAHCNCAYCEHLLHLQFAYSVFFQHKCEQRFGDKCPCLEVSEMDIQMPHLKYINAPICRGCTYTSQCSLMLKAAQCDRPAEQLQLGNPLAPTVDNHGFIDRVMDVGPDGQGRVKDGRLRGDVCICEPKYMRFKFVPGRCSKGSNKLEEKVVITIDDCYDDCAEINNCNYFTFYAEGEIPGQCELYEDCSGVNCNNATDNCQHGLTYQLAELGIYTNTRGRPQDNEVFLNATLQGTWELCMDCLRQYESIHCAFHCGPSSQRSFLHYPSGQSCATCILAGSTLFNLNYDRYEDIKQCVTDAISNAADPWTYCKNEGWDTEMLFNGVATHFLSECPGKKFDEYGVVCVPNVHAVNHFPLQILSRLHAINNTVWSLEDSMCLNAICEVVPRDKCYRKLSRWNFQKSLADEIGFLDLFPLNGAQRNASGLVLNKTLEHYFTTPGIPTSFEEFSLEAWVTISPTEKAENIALNQSVTSTTRWRENYLHSLAVDGNMKTYWAADLQPTPDPFEVYWEVDLEKKSYAEGIKIYWKSPAVRFEVLISNHEEGETPTWNVIYSMEENVDTFTEIPIYFQARLIRIQIYAAGDPIKTPFSLEEAVDYTVSIYEVMIMWDKDLSRLRYASAQFAYNHVVSRLVDNDFYTVWSSVPKTQSTTLDIAFSTFTVNFVRIIWVQVPAEFTIAWGETCNGPFTTTFVETLARLSISKENYTGGCVRIDVIAANTEYYDVKLVQIREVEVYGHDELPTPISQVYANAESSDHPASAVIDQNPATYWLYEVQEAGQVTIEFASVVTVLRMELTFAKVDNRSLCPSEFYLESSVDNLNWVPLDAVSSTCETDVVIRRFTALLVRAVFRIANETIGLKDWLVYPSSENLAAENNIAVDSEWVTNHTPSVRELHSPNKVQDQNFDTWWGAEFGKQFVGFGDEAILDFSFPCRASE